MLTQAGRDFIPIMAAISEWGRTYNGGGPPTSHLASDETGEPIKAVVVDQRTGTPLSATPMHLVMPG